MVMPSTRTGQVSGTGLFLRQRPRFAILIGIAALEGGVGAAAIGSGSSEGRHSACGSGRSTVKRPKRSSLRPSPLSSSA